MSTLQTTRRPGANDSAQAARLDCSARARCLAGGIGIGAMLSGKTTIAQPDLQIARAPEELSASFAEIARRVDRRVVTSRPPSLHRKLLKRMKTKKTRVIRCSICFVVSDVRRAESVVASSSRRTVTFLPTIT